MIPVIYESYNIARSPLLFGDQIMLRELYEKNGFEIIVGNRDNVEGAIFNISLYHNEAYIDQLNADISKLKWVVMVLTSNEFGSNFYKKIKHPNMKIWLQTPKKYDSADKFLPIGYPAIIENTVNEKVYDWIFAGQVTNDTRKSCVKRLKKMKNGKLVKTDGFAKGLPHEDYVYEMSRAKFAICPSGPATPDTFRVYEALELGLVPIVDNRWYWKKLGLSGMLNIVDDWSELPKLFPTLLKKYEALNLTSAQKWSKYKQGLENDLLFAIEELRNNI